MMPVCAARLAQAGFRVTLLEKAAVGNGSSSRSMAGIRAQFGVEETVIGMLYSEWFYAHFHDLLGTPPNQQQPAIRQNGYLFPFDNPAAAHAAPDAARLWARAQTLAAMQRRVGVPVELLNPADVGERWPHLATDRLIGATWCPTDGFLFPPVIYGEGVRRARELGGIELPILPVKRFLYHLDPTAVGRPHTAGWLASDPRGDESDITRA